MKIDKLILGDLKTNCYVVSHNNTAFVIDPACNGETIDAFLRARNYKLSCILNFIYIHYINVQLLLTIKKEMFLQDLFLVRYYNYLL